jgi:hypothetical protein
MEKIPISGLVVDIVGTEAGNRGRSCEEHDVCGSVLELDCVVRFRALQIVVEGMEQTALAVYWVTDGIDRCRVGFLRKHLIKHKQDYDGKLGQVIEILKKSGSTGDRKKHHHYLGCVKAVIINAPTPEKKKKKRSMEEATDTQGASKTSKTK